MNSSALAVLLLLSLPAFACRVQPVAQYVPPSDLVSRTAQIALATVVAHRPGPYRAVYSFRTIESLKGVAPERFELEGGPADTEMSLHSFTDHSQSAFWDQERLGRAPMYPDCRVWPSFSEGRLYLVFLGETRHVKGFEYIANPPTDQWLAHIRKVAGE